jgi:hypothetical protein
LAGIDGFSQAWIARIAVSEEAARFEMIKAIVEAAAE